MEKLSLNPWLSIWVRPRETIRAITATNPNYRFYLLAAIYGFPTGLQLAQSFSVASMVSLPMILIAALILSVFIGWVGITVLSGLLFWTGKWIGGKSSYQNLRAAVAWSNVPNLVDIAIWIVLLSTFGQQLFAQEFAHTPFTGSELTIVTTLFFVQIVAAVWGFILFLKMVSEVQGFSSWRALLNIIIPFVLLFGVMTLFSWVLEWASK